MHCEMLPPAHERLEEERRGEVSRFSLVVRFSLWRDQVDVKFFSYLENDLTRDQSVLVY